MKSLRGQAGSQAPGSLSDKGWVGSGDPTQAAAHQDLPPQPGLGTGRGPRLGAGWMPSGRKTDQPGTPPLGLGLDLTGRG